MTPKERVIAALEHREPDRVPGGRAGDRLPDHRAGPRPADALPGEAGRVPRILDDFVDAGVDGWHGIQPNIGMDLKLLKERYGDRMCFFGGVEIDTLVDGTPDDVVAEVRHAVKHAAHGGGLVLTSGNTLMPGVKFDNYVGPNWNPGSAHRPSLSASRGRR